MNSVKFSLLFSSIIAFGSASNWSIFSVWSGCSVTCGRGVEYRTRSCIGDYPGNGGCTGDWYEAKVCNMPSCGAVPTTIATPTTTQQQRSNCFNPTQPDSYRGRLSKTIGGWECQRWDKQYPHPHSYSSSTHPHSGLGGHNFCRNPDLDSKPWCFTANPLKQWEYCDPPKCSEYVAPTYPPTPSVDCYNHINPSSYRGQSSRTEGGFTCQSWTSSYPHLHAYHPSSFPNAGLGPHNFCRNPDNDKRPWCYTTNPGIKWAYCDLPACSSIATTSTTPNTTPFVPSTGGSTGGSGQQCGRPAVPMGGGQPNSDMEAEIIEDTQEFGIFPEDSGPVYSRFIDTLLPDDYSTQDIVGGEEARPGSLPWQVSLRRTQYRSHFCGASIIHRQYILTAAHCIAEPQRPESYYGVVGDHKQYTRDPSEVEVRFSEIFKHSRFNSATLLNDITLIKTATPMTFNSRIRPVCLPPAGAIPQNNKKVIVSGWGTTHGTGSNAVLRLGVVPIISAQECRNMQSGILNGMLCAGYKRGGVDSCQGDSGGPLVEKTSSGAYQLVGIVSWGFGCAQPNQPGVYAMVSYYIDWIKRHMQM